MFRIRGGCLSHFLLTRLIFTEALLLQIMLTWATTKVTRGVARRLCATAMRLVYKLRLPRVDVPWIRTSHGDFLHQNHYSQFWILSYSVFIPMYHFTPLQMAAILYLAILFVTPVFRTRAPCPCWRATNKKNTVRSMHLNYLAITIRNILPCLLGLTKFHGISKSVQSYSVNLPLFGTQRIGESNSAACIFENTPKGTLLPFGITTFS